MSSFEIAAWTVYLLFLLGAIIYALVERKWQREDRRWNERQHDMEIEKVQYGIMAREQEFLHGEGERFSKKPRRILE